MTTPCPSCDRTHRPDQSCLRGVLLVCGGRDYADWTRLCAALDTAAARVVILAVRHGAARGADALAHRWALDRRLVVEPVPADWRTYGKRAGPVRNSAMLELPPAPVGCVAFAGGAGTKDMVRKCEAAGIPVWRVGWTSPQDGAA